MIDTPLKKDSDRSANMWCVRTPKPIAIVAMAERATTV
jgi:hypothetical protein